MHSGSWSGSILSWTKDRLRSANTKRSLSFVQESMLPDDEPEAAISSKACRNLAHVQCERARLVLQLQ